MLAQKFVNEQKGLTESGMLLAVQMFEEGHRQASREGMSVQMSNEDLYNLALERFCSPHGSANPETHAFIQGYNLAAAKALLSCPDPESGKVYTKEQMIEFAHFSEHTSWSKPMSPDELLKEYLKQNP